jgi:FMN phosphatase YigB (HAD superfamily)
VIHCFDIFDTLITRRVFAPTDLYLFHAERLRAERLWGGSDQEWQQLRMRAELNARMSRVSREVMLEDIYEEIRRVTGMSQIAIAAAMRMEQEMEISLSVPIAENKKLFEAMAVGGQRAVLISDMYLPCNVLQQIVEQVGIANARIYASCEFGVTKRSGGLFKVVAQQERVALADLDHLGDNRKSDYLVPVALGSKAKWYRSSAPSADEVVLYRTTSISEPKARSVIAGAMRTARLANPYPQESREAAVWNLGAGVSGLLVLAFVSWTLQQAQKMGLRRLYYVARDGQIPSMVANVLCRVWNIPIEVRYLYGSRQAWHLPATRELDETSWKWLVEIPPGLTMDVLLERAGLSQSGVRDKLESFGLRPDQVLTARDAERCRDLLRTASAEILSGAAAAREKATAYLTQEGLFDEVPAGIVDIGWRGRLYTSLLSLMKENESSKRKIHAMYLGLMERPQVPHDLLSAYLFDEPDMPAGFLKKYLALYELMFSANHPGVVGYEFDQRGIAVPVLRKKASLLDHGWPVDAHQKAVLRLTEDVAAFGMHAAGGLCEARLPITRMLRRLFTRPSPEEANAYGSAMFSEEQTEGHSRELAPAFGWSDVARALLLGGGARYASTMWIEGSISRGLGVGRVPVLGGIGLLKSIRK